MQYSVAVTTALWASPFGPNEKNGYHHILKEHSQQMELSAFLSPPTDTQKMPNLPSHCTQIDITSTDNPTDTTVPHQKNTSSQSEVVAVLKEILATQKKSCDLLSDVLKHVSFQQRQRAAELQTWRENNPYVAQACRKAAKGLSHVHTDFLTTLAEEAAESAEDFTDSDYALGEFIDRYGPRLAHFNGVMQLLSQLAMPEDENQN